MRNGLMNYRELLNELEGLADEKYCAFHKKLLKNDNVNIIGVKIPVLRKIARSFRGCEDELMSFPDEFYEVTFIKLTAVANLPYEQFILRLDSCVKLMDNWATCDCFSPKCVAKHREEFIPYIEKYLSQPREFSQRFALTTLLSFYVEEKYIDYIFSCCCRADSSLYYVHMAVAWLVAEVLAKHYERGEEFLKHGLLDKKTHNKAIQKAKESYRLTPEQKINLNNLKR